MKGFSTTQMLALAAVVIAAVTLVGTAKFGWNLFSITGFSTLSLSSVDYSSNDPSLGGQSWVLTVSQNGAGQSAVGSFGAKQITDDGKTAATDFRLEINQLKNSAEYRINNDYDYLNWISAFVVGKFSNPFDGDANKICADNGGFYVYRPQASDNEYCLKRSVDGVKGTLASGDHVFESEVVYTRVNDSSVQRGTVSNVGATSTRVGSIGYAYWQGSLVTGESIPRPTDQDICALYGAYGGQTKLWRTIDCSNFQTWKNSFDASGLPTCIQGDQAKFLACIDDVNNLNSLVKSGRSFTSSGGMSATTIGSETSGKVILELDKQFYYPVITAKVQAGWLGILVPVGKPHIVSLTSEEFTTGSTGFIKARVKNIGDAQGSFDVNASCPSPISAGATARATLQPQQESDLYVTVSGSAAQKTSVTCTVQVNDVNQPLNKVTGSVVVTVNNLVLCTAGEKRAVGRYVQQCNAAGSGWDIIRTCPEGQLAHPATFECMDEDDDSVLPKDVSWVILLSGLVGAGAGLVAFIKLGKQSTAVRAVGAIIAFGITAFLLWSIISWFTSGFNWLFALLGGGIIAYLWGGAILAAVIAIIAAMRR